MESLSEPKPDENSSASTENLKADKCSRCEGERFAEVKIRQIDGTATIRKCLKCGLMELIRREHGENVPGVSEA